MRETNRRTSFWRILRTGLARFSAWVATVYRHNQLIKLESERVRARKLEILVKLRTRELENRAKALQQLNDKLRESTLRDPLTRLRNRRYLYEYLDTEIAAVYRARLAVLEKSKVSPSHDTLASLFFMMIDLDGFKTINDRYGHHAGDATLLQVSDILRRCARRSDAIIRWGGDEFVIVGHCENRLGIEKLAERIRDKVSHYQYTLGHGHVAQLSASIGLSLYPFVPSQPNLLNWEQVSDVADQAAYLAKKCCCDAWVAIYGTQKITSVEQVRDIGANVDKQLAQGYIEVKSSFPNRPFPFSGTGRKQADKVISIYQKP